MSEHQIPIRGDSGAGSSGASEVMVARNGRFLGTITVASEMMFILNSARLFSRRETTEQPFNVLDEETLLRAA